MSVAYSNLRFSRRAVLPNAVERGSTRTVHLFLSACAKLVLITARMAKILYLILMVFIPPKAKGEIVWAVRLRLLQLYLSV